MTLLSIVLLLLLSFLVGFYLFVIWRCLVVWNKIPSWAVPQNFHSQTKISVIIPARDEAKGIIKCLNSILNQNYPPHLFEILVIDDHSTDGTADLVESLKSPQIRVLKLADHLSKPQNQAYKKQALTLGINQAEGELIVTTDADCLAPPDWLSLIASYYEKHHSKFIAAPVNFYQEESLLERFQSLDFMGMMLLTGAGIHSRTFRMCNGANLAYPKKVFQEVNGFTGIDHLASGDDLLLLHKIAARYPNQIGFIKQAQATVRTKAKATWPSFFQQRLRWATKSSSYQEWQLTFILALIFLFCFSIVVSFFAIIFLGWTALVLFVCLLLLKSLADYFFLRQATQFFNRSNLIASFWPAQLLHIIYIVLIGIWSNLVKKYEWKGRKVQ